MADVKLCKDCKWCRPYRGPSLFWPTKDYRVAKCVRPNWRSPVTGEMEREPGQPSYAATERKFDGADTCGPEGKFWEAR
jgi:hypothetical protein